MPIEQYGRWLKGMVVTLPIVAQPVTDAVIGIRLTDPAIVQSLNTQHEGRSLVFTLADSKTQIPHVLMRTDWPGVLDGAWVSQSLNQPGAVHSLGYTYWGTLNSHGEVFIHWVHVLSGKRGSEYIDTLTTGVGNGVDDHNSPSILRLASGKLLVFYAPHNGPSVRCRAQTRAGDPGAWEAPVVVEGAGLPSYALPVQLRTVPGEDGGKIWVFYRDANNGYRSNYRTSVDAGRTWSDRTVIFRSPNNERRRSDIARPYIHAKASPDGRRIHFAVSDGHPKEVKDALTGGHVNSIYHCYFDSQTSQLHRSDGAAVPGGTFASPPINGFDTWTMTRACDGFTEQRPYWQWDLQVTKEGFPVIGSFLYVGAEGETYMAAVPVVSRWNGDRWINTRLTNLEVGCSVPVAELSREPYYQGGLALDPVNPTGILYLSAQDAETKWNSIFRVASRDLGDTWEIEQRLNTTRGTERQCIRPMVVDGYPGAGPEVFWMAGHYADFQQTYTSDGVAFSHNMFATGIQSYPRLHDGYAAFIKADLSKSSNQVHMYWDNPDAPEQEDPGGVFAGWLEYPRDVHWNRWDTGRMVDLAATTSFSALFIGRWSEEEFSQSQHTFFSTWTSTPGAAVLMREFGGSTCDVSFPWYTDRIVGMTTWNRTLTPRRWTTLAGVWDAGAKSGMLCPYVNGEALPPIPGSNRPMAPDLSPTTLRLGHSPHQTVDNWWRGEIGFVGITRAPLSAAWIREFALSNPFDPGWKYARFGPALSWDDAPTKNRRKNVPSIRK